MNAASKDWRLRSAACMRLIDNASALKTEKTEILNGSGGKYNAVSARVPVPGAR
jgi:chromosome condensin MukBEF complex kleisin-like MukF subunit